MRILAVVGARPNFVKIAPIMAELAEYPYIKTTLVHTGQHYDAQMSDSFFANLEIPRPDTNLKVQAVGAVPQIGEIMTRMEPVLERVHPDIVVVVGDVNSTVAAAIAAVKMGRPVAHVEAGLRSFDRSMPEEINRILTDSISDLLFTSEPSGEQNLRREGVGPEKIHFVGNVMIDTLFRYREQARQSDVLKHLGLSPRGYAVLTLHRPSNVDDEGTLGMLLSAIARIQAEIPVVFPVHPRTRRRLEALAGALPPMPGVQLANPMPYLDFLHLMGEARCVLTDSGGIQEETTALRIPCLTLRENTERPVTVSSGTNRVVGTEPAAIYEGWREVADGNWPAGELPELWDGKAASRIVRVLIESAREGGVDVRMLTTETVDWDAFVRSTPGGSPFHLVAWKRVVESTFGHRSRYLMAVRGGGLEGVLPLFEVRGLVGGRGLVSVPYAVYGGICAQSSEARVALLEAAQELAGRSGVQYVELRHRAEQRMDLPTKSLYVTFSRAISSSEEENLNAIPRKQRRMTRQGVKHGLRSECGLRHVDMFWDVYARSVHALGSPVFPRRLFRALAQEFGKDCELLTVWKGQQMVSGVLSLFYEDQVLPYYGGARQDALQYAVNDFMYWELMCHAARVGARTFDFGRSREGTGAYDFKRHWGFEPVPLPYQYLFVSGAGMPNVSPSNPKLHMAVQAWKRLPLPMTKLIGPLLTRYLP